MKTLRDSQKSNAHQPAVEVLRQADAEPSTLTDWIQLIHQAWTRGADRALELGRLMSRARQSLPYRSWSRLWREGGLPFSRRKGEMLAAIGQGVGELDAQNSAQLPPAWNTLYYLARLGQAMVEQLIQRGRIHPDLSLRQAQALLAEYHPEAWRKAPRSKPMDRLARLAAFIRAEMGGWSRAERDWVRKQLSVLAGEIGRQAALNGGNSCEVEPGSFHLRRFAQFADEPPVFPDVSQAISKEPQGHPISIGMS